LGRGKGEMNKEQILEVEVEAKRFLDRLEKLKKTDRYKSDYAKFDVGGSPESAALKRASMDLTKCLAKLRK
jgi:hypothetical protein